MARQYPSKKHLLEIADAAAEWAKVIRNNWPVSDATDADNPARFTAPRTADTDDERKQGVRQIVDVLTATKTLESLFADIRPGDPLSGSPAGLRRCFPPTKPANNAVCGWPAEVSRAVKVLKDISNIVHNAIKGHSWNNGMLPIPNKTVRGVEWAAGVIKAVATGSKRPRVTRQEANLRAREALKNRRIKWTYRGLAGAVGCSGGLVPKLPAWQAYKEEIQGQRKKKTPAPKAVSLTDKVLATTGQNDEELKRLMAEQKADKKCYRVRKTV
ncbi:MAG: hypothetical protein KKA28_14775 [Planctomycetes bacterium]|nr:hypothetical protein [Planctomycetota bacterium]MCG2684694.1 hypothetical protein [Planctomycetales bacterium]